MAKAKNTKTHNIFLLNKEKVQENLFNNQPTDVRTMIDGVVSAYPTRYHEQRLLDGINVGSFSVRMFFHEEKPTDSKLASFCRPFVQADQDIVKFKPRSASSVLFIWSEDHIFVITTGQGFRVVEDFCVSKFGMLVVSAFQRLFRITALDSNGMSSIVHSNKTIYANEIDFVDVDALDTVFKEVTGRLNDKGTVHSLLNLEQASKKKSVKITAKNFIQFSSSLNFEGLIHLLTHIDQYDYTAMQDKFNLIAPVNPKNNKRIVEKNNSKIIEKMYSAVKENKPLGMDLFHRFTIDFIGADTYSIVCNETELVATDDIEPCAFIKEAYTAYLEDQEDTLQTFSAFINSASIVSQKGDSMVTDGAILSHISGEIQVDGKNYYVFYGEYYFLSDSYSDRLNKSLKGKLLDERFVNYLATPWNGGSEDDFNKTASNSEGFVHLHKIKPEYIEFADLLKIDGDRVVIIHVKDGFDDDMRALDRQVELSVTRILDLKNNNNDEYMRKLYRNATPCNKGVNITTMFPTEEAFISTLKEKEVQYIVAIRPPIKDLLNNRSNIAKHCLNALILRCFNQGIDLKINIL